jgi:hypothetical protein
MSGSPSRVADPRHISANPVADRACRQHRRLIEFIASFVSGDARWLMVKRTNPGPVDRPPKAGARSGAIVGRVSPACWGRPNRDAGGSTPMRRGLAVFTLRIGKQELIGRSLNRLRQGVK